MELDLYKTDRDKLKAQCRQLETAANRLEQVEHQEATNRAAQNRMERFCRQVSEGLDTMTFEERQQLLRLVVERITVEDGRVRIETIIPTDEKTGKLRARHPEPVEG